MFENEGKLIRPQSAGYMEWPVYPEQRLPGAHIMLGYQPKAASQAQGTGNTAGDWEMNTKQEGTEKGKSYWGSYFEDVNTLLRRITPLEYGGTYTKPIFANGPGNKRIILNIKIKIADNRDRTLICTLTYYDHTNKLQGVVDYTELQTMDGKALYVEKEGFKTLMNMTFEELLAYWREKFDFGKKASLRGIKLIICEEAPAKKSGYTYQAGYDNDLSKVTGIKAHVLNDGNITIGIGRGIPKSDTKTLEEYGLQSDMTHEEAQKHSISIEHAIELLMEQVEIREDKLNAFLNRHKVILQQYQYDALIAFSYNMSTGGSTFWNDSPTATGSSMREYIQNGVYSPDETERVFLLYGSSNYNLKPRRQREANLFNGKGYEFDNDAVEGWFKNSMVPGNREK